jgi:hypothetical protein
MDRNRGVIAAGGRAGPGVSERCSLCGRAGVRGIGAILRLGITRLFDRGGWIAARVGPGSDLIARIVTWAADVRFMSRIR